MHTENDTTAFEQYVTAHRARVAVVLATLLSILGIAAWAVISDALNLASPTLAAWAVGLVIAASATAALAWYWSAE